MGDLLVLAAALTLAPALALSAPAAVAWSLRPAWRGFALAAPVGLLAGTIALQASRALPATAAAALAAGVGSAALWSFLRLPAARTFASLLAVAAIVAPAILLLDEDVRRSVRIPDGAIPGTGTGATAPVVLVVFDEWSVISILDAEGGIDRERFPNLARLADRATWYPNATTASNMTTHAVPALLTGVPPERDRLPTASDHPVNLFTSLAPTHDVVALEPITSLCPPNLNLLESTRPAFARRAGLLISDLGFVWLSLTAPESWAARLPPITRAWSGFGDGSSEAGRATSAERELVRSQPHRRNDERVADFRRFVDAIGPAGARPALYFAHTLLPHEPWEYLPSGRRYSRTRVYGLVDGTWTRDPSTVGHHHKRYLLQVEFVDRLIGELIARLESLDLFDRSVVAITADHGLSFEPGASLRYPDPEASEDHVLDLLAVPLIVKAPFQDRARVDRSPFSLVELTPRLLSLARGESGAAPGLPAAAARPLLLGERASEVRIPADQEPWRRGRLARQRELLGEENTPWAIGVAPELHGRAVADLPQRDSEVAARMGYVQLWEDLDPEAARLPAMVDADIVPPDAAGDRSVVVALNGVVADSVRPYRYPGGRNRIRAFLPEALFRPGRNRVELFLTSGRGDGLPLERLRSPRVFSFERDTENRYELLRGAWGEVTGLRRYDAGNASRSPRHVRLVPGSPELRGHVDAVVPLAARVADADPLRIQGRAFDAANPGEPSTLVFVSGDGTVTAYTGRALKDNGFRLRLPADPELVEKQGILAFLVGHRDVAVPLQFFYRPLQGMRGSGEFLTVSDGRRLPVRPPGDGLEGAVELVEAVGGTTQIRGWAADRSRGEAAREIVVYRDGRSLTNLGPGDLERSDIAERFADPRLLRTGFGGPVPNSPLPSAFAQRHRVFALMTRGVALELPLEPTSD